MTTELVARVERLESLAEIRSLAHRYALHFARLDAAALAELYDDEVLLRSGERGERATVEAGLAAAMRPPDGVWLVFLVVGNQLVELLDDDHAVGSVYTRGDLARGDGAFFTQAIHYRDHYRRREGRWVFSHQRQHDLVQGAPPGVRPTRLGPAHWPQRDVGRGEPVSWPGLR